VTGTDKTTLKKLQIKLGMRIAILHAPPEFATLLANLPEGVEHGTTVRGVSGTSCA
jgi:hypothetical protein